jgi:hypothetical protein
VYTPHAKVHTLHAKVNTPLSKVYTLGKGGNTVEEEKNIDYIG